MRLLIPLLLALFITYHTAHATSASVVYNLRIAATTRRQTQQTNPGYVYPGFQARQTTPGLRNVAAVTFFDQHRERYNGSRQTLGGGLLTLIDTPGSAFLRLETAVGHIVEKPLRGLKQSRTQLDDLLFTAGYQKAFSEHSHATFSGLFGVPTHGDDAINTPQFGIAHVSFGAQIDAAYAYTRSKKHSLFFATRYLRFLPRTIAFYQERTNSCLPFEFSPGNLFDMLVSHNSTFGRHQFEVGYNATFFFGASLYPPPPATLTPNSTVIRSSVYASYRCGFLEKSFAHSIGLAFAYGTDHTKQPISFNNIYALWVTWGIAFS